MDNVQSNNTSEISTTTVTVSKRSKRRRILSKKYDQYEVDKPATWDCPGCQKKVTAEKGGVVCSSCVAYWHFECVNVTEEYVNNLGNENFYCPMHNSDMTVLKKSEVNTFNVDSGNGNEKNIFGNIINLCVAPYVLNNKSL